VDSPSRTVRAGPPNSGAQPAGVVPVTRAQVVEARLDAGRPVELGLLTHDWLGTFVCAARRTKRGRPRAECKWR
jgi:hypothetical protein